MEVAKEVHQKPSGTHRNQRVLDTSGQRPGGKMLKLQEMIAELSEGMAEAALMRLNAYIPHLKAVRADVYDLVLTALKDGSLPFRADEKAFSSWLFARIQMFPPKGTAFEIDRDRESPTFGLPVVAKCSCGTVEVSLTGAFVTGVPAGGWPAFCDLIYSCVKCRKVKIANGRRSTEFVGFGEAMSKRLERERVANSKKKQPVTQAKPEAAIVVSGIKLDDETGHLVAMRRDDLASRGARRGKNKKKGKKTQRRVATKGTDLYESVCTARRTKSRTRMGDALQEEFTKVALKS